MTKKQIVLSILIGGLVATVLDVLVHGFLLGNAFYVQQTALFGTESSPLSLTLGDFVSVAVFVWVYQRVRSCFRGGAAGGAIFGFYAGVLIGFPTHLFLSIVIVDFAYALAWAWTLLEIVWCVCHGGRGRRQDCWRTRARHGDGLTRRRARSAPPRTVSLLARPFLKLNDVDRHRQTPRGQWTMD